MYYVGSLISPFIKLYWRINGFMSVHTTNSPSFAAVEHEVKRKTDSRKKLQGAPAFILASLLTDFVVN